MDWVVTIGDEEKVFVQYHDTLEYIKEILTQWNAFGDLSQSQHIFVSRRPNPTKTIGVSASETVEVEDIFGGLPENWNESQKAEYLKLNRLLREKGVEAVRAYIRDKS